MSIIQYNEKTGLLLFDVLLNQVLILTFRLFYIFCFLFAYNRVGIRNVHHFQNNFNFQLLVYFCANILKRFENVEFYSFKDVYVNSFLFI